MQIHQMYGNSEIINWTNQKLGKSIFIILFNFVICFRESCSCTNATKLEYNKGKH